MSQFSGGLLGVLAANLSAESLLISVGFGDGADGDEVVVEPDSVLAEEVTPDFGVSVLFGSETGGSATMLVSVGEELASHFSIGSPSVTWVHQEINPAIRLPRTVAIRPATTAVRNGACFHIFFMEHMIYRPWYCVWCLIML